MNTLKDYIRDDINLFFDNVDTLEDAEDNLDELLEEIMETIHDKIHKFLN